MKPIVCVKVILLAILTGASGTGCRTVHGHPPVPITVKPRDVVDAWIGFTESDGPCYRLVLQPGGAGYLRWLSIHTGRTGDEPITQWQIDQPTVECRFELTTDSAKPRLLNCDLRGRVMVARLTGVGEWTDEIKFCREESLDENLSLLRTRKEVIH